jgi:hypothetical protein
MSDSLRELIISELSSKLPVELIRDLLGSYESTLTEFRKSAWAETLWKAGKFAENVFRVLYFIVNSKVITEVPRMNDLREKLEELPHEKFSESVRILIPRITSAMIYDPRSKRGAVHVKPVDPDYLDSTLAVSASDWVLAELLQTYHATDSPEVRNAIESIITRKIPFVEKHANESFVTVHLGAEDEILLLLLDRRIGIDRTTVGRSMSNVYTSGRITQSLHSLLKKRLIVRVDNLYAITGPGESHISQVISKIR